MLLAIGSPARERELRDRLAGDGLVISGRCLDGPSLAERVQIFDSDVALASSDLHRLSPATLQTLREARLPLVLLADGGDVEKYAGLAHFVSSRCSPAEAADALRRAVMRGALYDVPPSSDGGPRRTDSGPGDGGGNGRLLVLLSGKGAPGVTTVAIGLAAALSATPRRVVLVDADLRCGNVGPYLDLDPSRGILGLAVGRQSAAALPVEEEIQDGPGFSVLAGIERPETHAAVTAELVMAAITSLRNLYEDVLVDGGQLVAATASPVIEALARAADGVLVVTGADLVAVWNAQCCLRHLRAGLGLRPESLAVVVNRREGRGQYGAREVEQALGASVLALLPEDRRSARRTAAEQLPITAAGGRLARELRALAVQLTEKTAAPVPIGKTRRWLPRLRPTAVGRR